MFLLTNCCFGFEIFGQGCVKWSYKNEHFLWEKLNFWNEFSQVLQIQIILPFYEMFLPIWENDAMKWRSFAASFPSLRETVFRLCQCNLLHLAVLVKLVYTGYSCLCVAFIIKLFTLGHTSKLAMTHVTGLQFMMYAKFWYFLTPFPLFCIFTQPPLLSSLNLFPFPRPPTPRVWTS